LAVVAAIALVASSCGGSGDSTSTTASTVPTTSTVQATSTTRPAFVSQPGDGTPVVVDYNPTSSDVTALLFVLQQDGVRVDAITIPGTGESHCEKAVANTLGLLALVGKEGIPVACGSTDPIAGQNQWPDAWRDAADQLPGLSLPDGGQPSTLSGPELLVAAVTQSTEPVKLLTLGPLTNVAEALALDPTMVSNLDAIYIMGGAVGVGGNVPANGVAEWNVWIDPAGARAVFESGAQIVLIPLDATNAVPVDRAWYNRLSDNLWTPSANAIFDLFSNSPAVLSGGFYFWDELAAAVMVDDSYVTFETMTLSVILGGIEEGRTKPTADGVEVLVAVDADAPRFTLDLISGLNGGRAVEIVTVMVDPEVEAYFAVLVELGDRLNAQLDAWFEENEAGVSAIFGGEPLPPDEARAVQVSFLSTVVAVLQVEAADLQALDPPAAVLDAHLGYLSISESIRALAAQAIESIDTATTEELAPSFESQFGLALSELIDACLVWQDMALDLRLDVELRCSG